MRIKDIHRMHVKACKASNPDAKAPPLRLFARSVAYSGWHQDGNERLEARRWLTAKGVK